MFDTINIGTTGLLTHAQGLRTVGNNLANVNTPGFKSGQLAFTDLFNKGAGGGGHPGAGGSGGSGSGLGTLGTHINFKAGLDTSTGNPLDLNIDGNGFYAIERDGQILYTRAGNFHFDEKGILVNAAGEHVQALADGKLADVSVDKLDRSLPKATTKVAFRGNLTSTVTTPPINAQLRSVAVYDTEGVSHPINLSFKNTGSGGFEVTVTDTAGATLTTGTIKFASGFPVAGANSFSFSYAPAGTKAFDVRLDFSENVTSLVDQTTLSLASQDGYAAGVRTDQSIDSDGTIKLYYSNGQTADGPRLALANFRSASELEEQSGSAFALKQGGEVEYGHAGDATFGTLRAGHLEGSNVDLAEEFGNLILMQRGYQASSHVISTANDMIQQLFDMKSR
jgi:flagellar hook protein FlgE